MSWRRVAVAAALCALLPAGGQAGEWEVGLLAGGRFDGELRDPVDFSRVPLDGAVALGLFGRASLGQGVWAEVAWSRAEHSLDASRTASVPAGLELGVRHLQAGLQLEFGDSRVRPFVGVAAGGSRFSPSSGGAEPEWALSFGGVVGAHWTYHERLRLRLEARGFAARPDPEGGTFCSEPSAGVCAVRNRDGFLLQSQVSLGVSVVF